MINYIRANSAIVPEPELFEHFGGASPPFGVTNRRVGCCNLSRNSCWEEIIHREKWRSMVKKERVKIPMAHGTEFTQKDPILVVPKCYDPVLLQILGGWAQASKLNFLIAILKSSWPKSWSMTFKLGYRNMAKMVDGLISQ